MELELDDLFLSVNLDSRENFRRVLAILEYLLVCLVLLSPNFLSPMINYLRPIFPSFCPRDFMRMWSSSADTAGTLCHVLFHSCCAGAPMRGVFLARDDGVSLSTALQIFKTILRP